MGVKRRRALVAYLAMECGWYEYRRRVGLKFCEYTNMKATPTRKDFDRFLQLRYDGVLDFNAYLRGWTKTWKKLAFYGGSTEETSPPPSPPPRTSAPGANNAPAEANFHRETALDFLRFGFHDALRPEEIGEQKERELRFFMDEIEAHWDLRFDDKAEKESFEFMFHTKEKLGAFHQPLLFTAWVNGVAGVTGLVLHAWGFTLRHGSNGCAYWTNSEVTTRDWKSRRRRKTVVVASRDTDEDERQNRFCAVRSRANAMMKRVQSCSYTVWASGWHRIYRTSRNCCEVNLVVRLPSWRLRTSACERCRECLNSTTWWIPWWRSQKSTHFANRRSTGTVLVPLSSRGRVNATASAPSYSSIPSPCVYVCRRRCPFCIS